MKQKLTITVDAELVPLVRQYAADMGMSLSSLVEQALWELAGEQHPTFEEKWRGNFRAAERENDARYDSLASKYLQ